MNAFLYNLLLLMVFHGSSSDTNEDTVILETSAYSKNCCTTGAYGHSWGELPSLLKLPGIGTSQEGNTEALTLEGQLKRSDTCQGHSLGVSIQQVLNKCYPPPCLLLSR